MVNRRHAGPAANDGTKSRSSVQAVILWPAGYRPQCSVPALPKGLARVAGRSFLDHVREDLAAAGAREIVLCTPQLSQRKYRARYGRPGSLRATVVYSVDPSHRGGAVVNAGVYVLGC
jgi:NDP-sugar pyrophosphorylase family protein